MDIINTPLEDLFDRLSQSVASRAKGRRAPDRKEHKRREAVTLTRPIAPPSLKRPIYWQDEAIILPVFRTYCRSCGAQHELANIKPLIRRRHKRLGIHCTQIDFPENYPTLPRYLEYRSANVSVCQSCLPVPQVDPEGPRQLSLSFETPQ